MVRHVASGIAVSSTDLGVDVGSVSILNLDPLAMVYVRVDGEDAVLEGDDSYAVPPGARRTLVVDTNGPTVVSHVSDTDGALLEIEA